MPVAFPACSAPPVRSQARHPRGQPPMAGPAGPPLLRFIPLQRNAGRAALSGAASPRTMPLRRWIVSSEAGPLALMADRPLPMPRLRSRPCGFSPDASSEASDAAVCIAAAAWVLRRIVRTRVMHGRCCLHGPCSATRRRKGATWPDDTVRHRSWGSGPSQFCSCPQVSGRYRPSFPPAVRR